jgi:hypothetical protein
MTDEQRRDRMTMPGEPPTDEDLRHDVELTRQELAETVAALGEKVDVKSRAKAAAHRRAEAIQTRGDVLVGKLPDPVATKVAPAWHSVSHKPAVPLAALAALVALLVTWLRIRRH